MTFENYMLNRENRLRNHNQGNCGCNPQVGNSTDVNRGTEGIFCGCRASNIRDIRQIFVDRNRGVSRYLADADLRCNGIGCSGRDSDIRYTWNFDPIFGNFRVEIGPGGSTITVYGKGVFELSVQVVFTCSSSIETDRCTRDHSRIFNI